MEQDKPKSKTKDAVSILVMIGVVIFVSVAFMTYQSPKIDVADADEIASLKAQIGLLNQTANFHQEVLQQHNTMIGQLGNSTDVIVAWAQYTEGRITALEEQK